jgi:hypothetical protein
MELIDWPPVLRIAVVMGWWCRHTQLLHALLVWDAADTTWHATVMTSLQAWLSLS